MNSSYDLCDRVLIGCFQQLDFSCQLPVPGIHLGLSSSCCSVPVLFIFSLCDHGFLFCSHVKLLGLGGRHSSFCSLSQHWANGQTSAVKAQGGSFSVPLGLPNGKKIFPNLKNQDQLRVQLPLLVL